jgi:NAD(P)-dependent dehydrogenase (short-subunit alcohol dehydrogenase family)
MAETAFITGAGSGIGAATALRLAARGAIVALFDRSEAGVRRTADAIESSAGRALALVGDVTDFDRVGEALAQTASESGGVDTVVACAGIEVMGTVAETPPAPSSPARASRSWGRCRRRRRRSGSVRST